MYAIYITDALVCGSQNSNTSDRSHLLFTREAGMLWTSAKSAREERSKHRFALQDFSLSRVSLVRGKGGWRVTGAEPITNLYYATDDRDKRTCIRDTVRLLRRFLRGETPAPSLFDDVVETLRAETFVRHLSASGHKPADQVRTVLTLRILHTLGYVDPSHVCRPLIEAEDAAAAYLLLTDENERESERAILHAFEASHL